MKLKQPNAYGLYDMLGNEYEWVGDWYAPLRGGADPTGPATGTSRTIRGAAFAFNDDKNVRVSFRSPAPPSNRGIGIGFRCAMD